MDDSPPLSTSSAHPDPVAASLSRLEERLARIEARIDRLTQVAPAAIATAVDTFDAAVRTLEMRGVDMEERVQNALHALERLTSPEATRLLSQLLELARRAPDAVALITDVMDGQLGALRDAGIDLEARVRVLAKVAEQLTQPEAIGMAQTLVEHMPSLQRLMSSGLLGPGPIDIVSRAGQALSDAQQSAPTAVGAFGLLRALSDEGVQHALGLLIAFARNFGRTLAPNWAAHALPSHT